MISPVSLPFSVGLNDPCPLSDWAGFGFEEPEPENGIELYQDTWTEVCLCLPSKKQHRIFEDILHDTRVFYNALLEHKWASIREWNERGKFVKGFEGLKTSAFDLFTQITIIRHDEKAAYEAHLKAHPEDTAGALKELRFSRWPVNVLRDVAKRSVKSFDTFWARRKKGLKGGKPRFKPAARWASFGFADATGVSIKGDVHTKGTIRVKHSAWGALRVRLHRPLPEGAKLVGCRFKRTAMGAWRAHLTFKRFDVRLVNVASVTRALDFGLSDRVVDSDGEAMSLFEVGPKARQKRLKVERQLARQKRGSKRREKTRRRLARLYEKETNMKRTREHTDAKRIVDAAVNDDIKALGLEKADVAKLKTKIKIQENVPDGAFAHLSKVERGRRRKMSDANWGALKRYIEVKAERAGLRVVQVSAAYTSMDCARCGKRGEKKELSQRQHLCKACGFEAQRDVNAALNVMRRARVREGFDVKPSAKAWWTPPRTLWDHNGQRACVLAQSPQAKKNNTVLVGESTVKPDGAPQGVSDGGAVLLWETLDLKILKRGRYANSFNISN